MLVVGAGFSIEGDIRGKGALIVGGMVKGTVHAESIKLTETGQIVGHVECEQLDLSGKLHGSFSSHDVIIRESGSVTAAVDVQSSGTCLVVGTLNANVKANKLKIEASGNLNGSVNADQMDVYGRVNGQVDASDVVVRNGAFIDGSIHYGNLAMERGSDVSGQIQRKHHDAERSGTTASAATSGAADSLRIDLPLEAVKALRKNPDAAACTLKQSDGTDAPPWILIDHDSCSLSLQRAAFEQLMAEGHSLMLHLKIGDEAFSFKLPPSAI